MARRWRREAMAFAQPQRARVWAERPGPAFKYPEGFAPPLPPAPPAPTTVLLAAASQAPAVEPPQGLVGWLALLWPFPAVIGSTFLIAWASEVAAFFVSRGMALALLAVLQVLPEFAVEAVLAHNAALDPSQLQFVTANFTGANRILVGLALPVIFLITLAVRRRDHPRAKPMREMRFDRVNSVEVVFLLVPSLYALSFWFRHSISLVDTALLLAIYIGYLLVLYRLPVAGDEEKQDLHGVPAWVMKKGRRFQGGFAAGAFLVGGFVLFLTVEPFVHNMQYAAVLLGISAYLVVQYVAPILSEFPEFLTSTYWSRHGKGEMAFMNVTSAKINQWTLLIGMIPLVFVVTNFTAGHGRLELPLDLHQQVEVLLTTAQGLFAAVCLLKLRFLLWEALALLSLWAFQAVDFVWDHLLTVRDAAGNVVALVPTPFGSVLVTREWVTIAYFALILAEVALYHRQWSAFSEFRAVWRQHVRPPGGRPPRARPGK
jgi:cation:H+ antiporter